MAEASGGGGGERKSTISPLKRYPAVPSAISMITADRFLTFVAVARGLLPLRRPARIAVRRAAVPIASSF